MKELGEWSRHCNDGFARFLATFPKEWFDTIPKDQVEDMHSVFSMGYCWRLCEENKDRKMDLAAISKAVIDARNKDSN